MALWPSALLAAKGGMSQSAFAREMRSLGMGARDSEMAALFKMATKVVGEHGDEAFANPSATPSESEMLPWATKAAEGVRQNISLVYRDRITGHQNLVPYSAYSENGMAREHAIAAAIDSYSEHAEAYGQDLIGAAHTSTYRFTPFGA